MLFVYILYVVQIEQLCINYACNISWIYQLCIEYLDTFKKIHVYPELPPEVSNSKVSPPQTWLNRSGIAHTIELKVKPYNIS